MQQSEVSNSVTEVSARQVGWKKWIYEILAAEISSLTRYYDEVIQWLPMAADSGLLISNIKAPKKYVIDKEGELPDMSEETYKRTALVINGNFNHHYDIQKILLDLKKKLSRGSRLIVIAYNPYLSWLYTWANRIGLRKGEVPTTFLTRVDLNNIVQLAGYQIVKSRSAVYFPWKCAGFGNVINRLFPLIPGFHLLGLTTLMVLRPVISDKARPSLSIVIPARNEKGNIENALKRMPDLEAQTEIIFVEGHSSDGTWEEIQRVAEVYRDRFSIKKYQQIGKGKGDAVRLGFSQASGDLLTILDADLTMPPELLTRFYEAYRAGLADFVNGTRLVYPMEGEAMRFLNRLGNVFFAKALSFVLGTPIGDSLCGTKLVSRADYDRMIAWRNDFGDFDPFGDFELLFPAAALGLGIIDIPVRYRARTYGSTNISRFRHGFMLLKMTVIGLFRIRTGRTVI